jgi:hypothetical protein
LETARFPLTSLAVTVFVVWLVGAVLVWPTLTRRCYGRLCGSHPHTCTGDVRRDVTSAVTSAAGGALAWPVLLAVTGLRVAGVAVGVLVIGRGRLSRDLRAARVQHWENELATTPDPMWEGSR